MFIQLSTEDTKYLLNLIEETDSDTVYTAKQRGYTVPKLLKIQSDPHSARLAWQDVNYLLELITDSGDLEEGADPNLYQTAVMVQMSLLEIQKLQTQKVEKGRSILTERSARRLRRSGGGSGAGALQEHFEHTV